jgi:hypothetical protein
MGQSHSNAREAENSQDTIQKAIVHPDAVSDFPRDMADVPDCHTHPDQHKVTLRDGSPAQHANFTPLIAHSNSKGVHTSDDTDCVSLLASDSMDQCNMSIDPLMDKPLHRAGLGSGSANALVRTKTRSKWTLLTSSVHPDIESAFLAHVDPGIWAIKDTRKSSKSAIRYFVCRNGGNGHKTELKRKKCEVDQRRPIVGRGWAAEKVTTHRCRALLKVIYNRESKIIQTYQNGSHSHICGIRLHSTDFLRFDPNGELQKRIIEEARRSHSFDAHSVLVAVNARLESDHRISIEERNY